MDVADYLLIALFAFVFIVLALLPYYLKNQNFLRSMKFFNFEKQKAPIFPPLLIIHNKKHPPTLCYSGKYKNIPMRLIPLANGYLIITPGKKYYEGTYVVSKLGAHPKPWLEMWNQKAPVEYKEFNDAFYVFALSPDKSFYDINPEHMQALLKINPLLTNTSFELNKNYIFTKFGFDEPPPRDISSMLADVAHRLSNLNNHSKIQGVLDQAVLVTEVFNK